jgi:nicotinate-nucleotide adenylyltransferase
MVHPLLHRQGDRVMNYAMRIGILGGTFDPVHIGHLILAEEAWARLRLAQVLFVPAGDPPHKRGLPISPVQHRLCMLELAIADNPHFVLSRVDADRPGPHYTVDMVKLLQEQFGPQTELFFLMGFDALMDLPNWHQPQELLRLCRVVALTRFGYHIDWARLEAALPGLRERTTLLPMPELEIASHVLQQRVREGWPIRYQVPAPVEEYIYRHGLYRNDAPASGPRRNLAEESPETF